MDMGFLELYHQTVSHPKNYLAGPLNVELEMVLNREMFHNNKHHEQWICFLSKTTHTCKKYFYFRSNDVNCDYNLFYTIIPEQCSTLIKIADQVHINLFLPIIVYP